MTEQMCLIRVRPDIRKQLQILKQQMELMNVSEVILKLIKEGGKKK